MIFVDGELHPFGLVCGARSSICRLGSSSSWNQLRDAKGREDLTGSLCWFLGFCFLRIFMVDVTLYYSSSMVEF